MAYKNYSKDIFDETSCSKTINSKDKHIGSKIVLSCVISFVILYFSHKRVEPFWFFLLCWLSLIAVFYSWFLDNTDRKAKYRKGRRK